MDLKRRFEGYTETEFLMLVTLLFRNDSPLQGAAYDRWHNGILQEVEALSEHPNAFSVIAFPAKDEEDSPEGIVKRIKEWRAANGKPGFKPA